MSRERRQNGWVEKIGKSWTGYWYVYQTVDGKEKRLRRSKVLGLRSQVTKGAAEDALREHIRDGRPPTSDATFVQLANWYLKTNKGRWSKGWYSALCSIFKHQIIPQLGQRVAAEITRSEVQQALNDIASNGRSQSESLIKKCLTHIRAVFDMAIDDELLERNPAPAKKIKLPPTRSASERFLSFEECRRLLAVANTRDNLILRIFVVLGLRPGELFALRVNDVQPGELRIDQTVVDYKLKGGAKTQDSKANVPLPPMLEADIRVYIRQQAITDLLFPSETKTPISPDNYLDRVLKQLGVAANIDVTRRMVVIKRGKNKDKTKEILTSSLNHQILRRTTGTHFQKHGQIKDTQSLLRHTDPQTTLKHYQKTLEESLISAVEGWDAELTGRTQTKQQKLVN
jgi:integrase